MGEIAQHTPPETWSDDELLGFVQGDSRRDPKEPEPARALEILFERHHARVHAQCSRLLDDSELADDVTQDVFLGLLDASGRYEGRQHFSSWLYIVVRNHCLNVLRRRRKEVQTDPEENWSDLLVEHENPGQDFERHELACTVDEICAEHLTPRERQVVHLRYVWGLRVKQINEVLGLENVSGARTHLATATRKLQRAFRARFGPDGLESLLREG